MKTSLLIFILCAMAVSGSTTAHAVTQMTNSSAKSTSTPKKAKTKSMTAPSEQSDRANTSIIIDTGTPTPESSSSDSNPSVSRLFKNPVFASGLSSGADAINHSIDSLMESLFYNLLDNNIKFPLSGSAGVNLGLTRNVFNARNGAYVVVDRLGLGPSYGREIYRYNSIPVTLGAQQSTEVFDIYLRTDPMRVADNKTLPKWRFAVNNWFGLLPFLETVLPPSFNVNEMYDPFRQVEVPFTVPLSVEATSAMDIGAIKSYSISGGVNIGTELSDGIKGFKDQLETGSSALNFNLPFTIFRTGSYRINVLKKDANTMWVGFVDANRLGQKIETKLGKAYYLLAKTLPYWKGMLAPVFPVDFSVEEAIADALGRVYSFDLRNDEARTAFVEAVHGNFAPSQISWLRSKEDKKNTGVTFFYTKKERRFETSVLTGSNIFVTNRHTTRTHSDAVVEITDATGRYHILEANEDSNLVHWDLLTGHSDSVVSLHANLFVRKVIEKEKSEGDTKSHFEFLAEGNPIDLTFSLSLNDKFVEVENLNDYFATLARFTQLKMDGIPGFDIREPALLAQRRKSAFFSNDNASTHTLHVTPTHLGRFEGYASIRMTNAQLMDIAGLPRAEIWKGLCTSFQVSNSEKCLRWERSLFWRNIYRAGSILSQPMRLVDYRWRTADTVDEIESAVAALKKFYEEKKPETKQAALRELFTTEYPVELIEGLLRLSNLREIPRSIELETQPKGNASEEIKSRYRKIGGLRFTSEKEFPPPLRYDTTREIDGHFEGANLSFAGIKPIIKKISLYREDPPKLLPKQTDDATDSALPILTTRVSVSKVKANETLSVYIKLEQTGQIQLAKLKLIEEVVDIPVLDSLDASNQVNFILKLSGPQSHIANLISEESLTLGGSFRLTMTISSANRAWSDEKSLEFTIENGQLRRK
jgi:hypothetical protein